MVNLEPRKKRFAYGMTVGISIALLAYGIIVPYQHKTETQFITSELVILITLVELVVTPAIVFEVVKMQSKTLNLLLGCVWGFGILPYIIAFQLERVLTLVGINVN